MSATYTPALLDQLEALMTQPQRVLLSQDTTSLLGVRQFYSMVPGASSSWIHVGKGFVLQFLPHFMSQRRIADRPSLENVHAAASVSAVVPLSLVTTYPDP